MGKLGGQIMKQFIEFLEDNLIQNDDWLTNGHFIIKKDALGIYENKFLAKQSHDKRAGELYQNIVKDRELSEHKTKDKKFIPKYIIDGDILASEKSNIGIKKVYYDWFTKKGFELYTINPEKEYDPLGLYKNSKFVGVLLPCNVADYEDTQYIPITYLLIAK